MNVGIIVRHTAEGMRESFANAAAQSFHHCQLVSWDPALWTDENAEEIKTLTAEYGVEITAFWCGWDGPKRWNFTEGPETLGIVPVTAPCACRTCWTVPLTRAGSVYRMS